MAQAMRLGHDQRFEQIRTGNLVEDQRPPFPVLDEGQAHEGFMRDEEDLTGTLFHRAEMLEDRPDDIW